ncbi:thiamine biosynthesis protein ApbE [Vibrio sp. 10N.286.45.A3]|uniref:FAD:protein FMN transferase n=1 Tax=Vibrio TaxID=662 RepID=UPI000C83C768|nr:MULTISPECIES: FAD:protein FMN transferase [unclassified Vibrio]PMI22142.1 thiamine biosynthesis protein ApbE [Vibrio sp. 10N.286.46.E10]PTO96596.1 thiamine biosynthesis protein ApbE [Vibrio sp. 10N.286.48.B8]PTP07662.1 thiamine biosynthesis protein ApbE [Vibrio sp. 10N.286.45.A3]TKE79922.1 FAD:protein FMN transferase [Vibrio sp. F12]TKE86806.1 FAD:protein FMN transferase [Vibrio sp. F12]
MNSKQPFVHRFHAMTVPCEVQILSLDLTHFPKACAKDIADEIEQNTHRLEGKYNFYSDDSWLTRHINQRTTSEVELDSESAEVFEHLDRLSQLTFDTFDTTVGSIKHLLKQKPKMSHSHAFQALSSALGKQAWELKETMFLEGTIVRQRKVDQQKTRLHVPDSRTRFDFGGVIKEYSVDQAVKIGKRLGATSMLVNFGGDIYALGTKPDGSPFNIAVLDPRDNKTPFFAVPITDAALTTSAHSERQMQFGDKTTSHIFSKQDVEKKILSVTAIASSTLEAGVLSTSLTLNPNISVPEESAVIYIDDQLHIHQNTEFLHS